MSVIDDVKARLDIVEVIGQYVKLTRSGRNYKGLSPFQNERSPSFFVFPETQTYKDFSSGEQGDLFKFMMKKEGWTFAEALRELAQRAGVQLEERTEEQRKSIDHETRLRDACALAADYFHRLFLTAPQAEHCRAYVKDKRLLSEQTIIDWQIGYSLMDYQALINFATAKGYTVAELVAAGLVVENEEGRRYDRFRGRLMIPIRDEKGRVVGFGSRSLDGSEPKYMNSPQTALFDKSRLLFGLDKARASIRNDKISVIVEGYMDVIGTHQAGFTNVVAGMGTSLTEDQFKMLKRLADRIVLALDADAAGNRAVLRGVDVARGAFRSDDEHDDNFVLDGRGVIRNESRLKADIRVAILPDGKDPDEVVLESPDVWRDCVAHARPVVEHVITIALSSFDPTDPRAKSDAVKAVAPILQDLSDPVQRDFYIQQLARRLQLSTRAVSQAVDLANSQKPKAGAFRPNPATPARPDESLADPASRQLPATSKQQLSTSNRNMNLEAHLLAVLMQKPELLMDANVALTRANLDVLGEADFMNPALQVGFQQLSRAAMGQPLPEASAGTDDWLSMIADDAALEAALAMGDTQADMRGGRKDELFLREETIRTALRLRNQNLTRECQSLGYLIDEVKEELMAWQAATSDGRTALDGEGDADAESSMPSVRLTTFMNQKIQMDRKLERVKRALKLRSALVIN